MNKSTEIIQCAQKHERLSTIWDELTEMNDALFYRFDDGSEKTLEALNVVRVTIEKDINTNQLKFNQLMK